MSGGRTFVAVEFDDVKFDDVKLDDVRLDDVKLDDEPDGVTCGSVIEAIDSSMTGQDEVEPGSNDNEAGWCDDTACDGMWIEVGGMIWGVSSQTNFLGIDVRMMDARMMNARMMNVRMMNARMIDSLDAIAIDPALGSAL